MDETYYKDLLLSSIHVLRTIDPLCPELLQQVFKKKFTEYKANCSLFLKLFNEEYFETYSRSIYSVTKDNCLKTGFLGF